MKTDPIQRAYPPPTLLPSKPPKRKRETEQQLNPPSPKRPRTSYRRTSDQDVDSVTYWTQTYHWSRGYLRKWRNESFIGEKEIHRLTSPKAIG